MFVSFQLNKVEDAAEKIKSTEQTKLLENMKKALEEGGQIQDQLFEEHLYTTIVRPRRLQDGFRRRSNEPRLGTKSNMSRRGFAG